MALETDEMEVEGLEGDSFTVGMFLPLRLLDTKLPVNLVRSRSFLFVFVSQLLYKGMCGFTISPRDRTLSFSRFSASLSNFGLFKVRLLNIVEGLAGIALSFFEVEDEPLDEGLP